MSRKLRGPRRPSLNIKEAAEYMGVSVRWMKRAVAEGRIKYWKTAPTNGWLMFNPDDLDEFIEQNTVEPSAL